MLSIDFNWASSGDIGWFQYPPLLLPPVLDPEAGLSVWHPARETASEMVRIASNADAMRLKFIWFPHEFWTSAQQRQARYAALMS